MKAQTETLVLSIGLSKDVSGKKGPYIKQQKCPFLEISILVERRILPKERTFHFRGPFSENGLHY